MKYHTSEIMKIRLFTSIFYNYGCWSIKTAQTMLFNKFWIFLCKKNSQNVFLSWKVFFLFPCNCCRFFLSGYGSKLDFVSYFWMTVHRMPLIASIFSKSITKYEKYGHGGTAPFLRDRMSLLIPCYYWNL